MVAVSIMVEGQNDVTWERWQRVVAEVETLGFAGLFRSDHFTDRQPPDGDALELIVSLAHLAGRTERIHFGSMVAPFSFREPVMLARQAAALDVLSRGRIILGVGAGWQEREHAMFGYDLGDVPTRMARFEEGLEVVTRLLRSHDPVTFEGRFYTLREATLRPRSYHPSGVPILVGGNGPTRTLPLVARYADIWNGVFLSPEEFSARSADLDGLLRAAGRPASAVRRTVMTGLIFGRDEAELRRVVARTPGVTPSDAPLATHLETLRAERHIVAGTAPEVAAQIAAYAGAGVEEIMLQWLDLDDVERLRAFAHEVLPRL
ncbi:MAG: LLM class F420-dependent oxidoreductase [Chloroflexota bacterium]